MLQQVEFPERPPEPGEIKQIASGISWVRVPLPFRLNHVNCWVLDAGDHWTVIDCGVEGPETRKLWIGIGDELSARKPIRRFITTHAHSDHVGMAGFFVDHFATSYETSLIEFQTAQWRHAETHMAGSDHIKQFLAAHGCGEDVLGSFDADRQRAFSYLGRQPTSFKRLVHGATIDIGGRVWRVIVGSGHSEEHISLYCASDRILIAGDQILPKITPMVGVFPSEPAADPLGAYVETLKRFADLPEDTLVLPSHGEPFTGLKPRLSYLSEHHEARLAKIEAILRKPGTAADISGQLFARAVREGQGRLALAETLAHLNRLVATGKVECRRQDGLFVYALI